MAPLSDNLKRLLKHAAISENELARRTGISQQIINRILSGENTNPKLATLSPLAHYFSLSISQLIGDEAMTHPVPLLAWDDLGRRPLDMLFAERTSNIMLETEFGAHFFALNMNDDSMEPKFAKDNVLIFDVQKALYHGAYALLTASHQCAKFRQIFIKNNQCYEKALNPNQRDYSPRLLSSDFNITGILVQSRTKH